MDHHIHGTLRRREYGGEYEDVFDLPWTKIEIDHWEFWLISE
jgi:hypothetical protein